MGHDRMKYSLPKRDIIAASIKIMVEAHKLDGMVPVGSCDKIVPGMLIAAAHLNIPTIFVDGGRMLPRNFKRQKLTVSKWLELMFGTIFLGLPEDIVKETIELSEYVCPRAGSAKACILPPSAFQIA